MVSINADTVRWRPRISERNIENIFTEHVECSPLTMSKIFIKRFHRVTYLLIKNVLRQLIMTDESFSCWKGEHMKGLNETLWGKSY